MTRRMKETRRWVNESNVLPALELGLFANPGMFLVLSRSKLVYNRGTPSLEKGNVIQFLLLPLMHWITAWLREPVMSLLTFIRWAVMCDIYGKEWANPKVDGSVKVKHVHMTHHSSVCCEKNVQHFINKIIWICSDLDAVADAYILDITLTSACSVIMGNFHFMQSKDVNRSFEEVHAFWILALPGSLSSQGRTV